MESYLDVLAVVDEASIIDMFYEERHIRAWDELVWKESLRHEFVSWKRSPAYSKNDRLL